jgi:hypothetical protein
MRGKSKTTVELVEYACKVLKEIHPQTLRQLHYAIFSRAEIAYDNCRSDYQRLSRVTSQARRQYRQWELMDKPGEQPPQTIPHDWIVDETRVAHSPSVWKDTAEYIDVVRSAYRRDNWQDQDDYCEIWSEKATVLAGLMPITKKRWGVTTRNVKGFGSAGMECHVGRLFEGIDKPITVFFLGDHDPSGIMIEEDIHRRAQKASGFDFPMIRLAIHPDDIALFDLPPQRIKDTDSRAAGFKLQFGDEAPTVELDALPAAELHRRVDAAISSLVDHERWNRAIAVQQAEFECIARIADQVRNLPQQSV